MTLHVSPLSFLQKISGVEMIDMGKIFLPVAKKERPAKIEKLGKRERIPVIPRIKCERLGAHGEEKGAKHIVV